MPVPRHVVHADVIENEQHECADAHPIKVVTPLAKISLSYLSAHKPSFCAGIRPLTVGPGCPSAGHPCNACVAPFCAGIRPLTVGPGCPSRATRATHALHPVPVTSIVAGL